MMDDIEDLVQPEDGGVRVVRELPPQVGREPKERISIFKDALAQPCDALALSRSVPGTQAVWLRTFGCAHNVSDSEYMAGALQSYGYR